MKKIGLTLGAITLVGVAGYVMYRGAKVIYEEGKERTEKNFNDLMDNLSKIEGLSGKQSNAKKTDDNLSADTINKDDLSFSELFKKIGNAKDIDNDIVQTATEIAKNIIGSIHSEEETKSFDNEELKNLDNEEFKNFDNEEVTDDDLSDFSSMDDFGECL